MSQKYAAVHIVSSEFCKFYSSLKKCCNTYGCYARVVFPDIFPGRATLSEASDESTSISSTVDSINLFIKGFNACGENPPHQYSILAWFKYKMAEYEYILLAELTSNMLGMCHIKLDPERIFFVG